MKKKLRRVLTVALGCVLAVSLIMIARQMLEDRANHASYEEAEQVVRAVQSELSKKPEEEPASSAAEEDEDAAADARLWAHILEELRGYNEDVVGWIEIPDTELSYPILRGDDNAYYLNHTWDRVRNAGGAIFADYRCTLDGTEFHTVLYGHRMRNGSMFGSLKYYNDQSYWQAHPEIRLVDGAGVHTYDIFAAWEASVDSLVYQPNLNTEAQRQAFLDTCMSGSWLDTGIVPGPDDKILTLSTCTGRGYNTRWVVQAVERRAS